MLADNVAPIATVQLIQKPCILTNLYITSKEVYDKHVHIIMSSYIAIATTVISFVLSEIFS